MNAQELRALQAPIKDRYKADPRAAVVTLKAEGRIGEGIAKDAPVGFGAIRLRFELDTDASAEQKNKLVELTERYCVVLQTIRSAAPVRASL